MSPLQISTEHIFTGSDLSRPRWTVEKEKLHAAFPGFQFYGHSGMIVSVQGYITTRDDNQYLVKISIADDYPYSLPDIYLPNTIIDSNCRHRFSDNRICVMRANQWSSVLSIAVLVSKAAVWLNKYDVWQRNGHIWPGTEQQH